MIICVIFKIREVILQFTLTKYHVDCLCLKMPISIQMPVSILHFSYLHDRYISKFDIIGYLFASLVIACCIINHVFRANFSCLTW